MVLCCVSFALLCFGLVCVSFALVSFGVVFALLWFGFLFLFLLFRFCVCCFGLFWFCVLLWFCVCFALAMCLVWFGLWQEQFASGFNVFVPMFLSCAFGCSTRRAI